MAPGLGGPGPYKMPAGLQKVQKIKKSRKRRKRRKSSRKSVEKVAKWHQVHWFCYACRNSLQTTYDFRVKSMKASSARGNFAICSSPPACGPSVRLPPAPGALRWWGSDDTPQQVAPGLGGLATPPQQLHMVSDGPPLHQAICAGSSIAS